MTASNSSISQNIDFSTIIFEYPELTRSDLAVLAAIDRLGEGAYQEDIAELARVTVRTVSRSVTALAEAGLLLVHRVYDRIKQRTKNFYRIAIRQVCLTMPVAVDRPKIKDKDLNSNDDNEDLDFIDPEYRTSLRDNPNVTDQLIEAWRDWIADPPDWCKKPARFVYSRLRRGIHPDKAKTPRPALTGENGPNNGLTSEFNALPKPTHTHARTHDEADLWPNYRERIALQLRGPALAAITHATREGDTVTVHVNDPHHLPMLERRRPLFERTFGCKVEFVN